MSTNYTPKKREIESFILEGDYFNETFLNGNITHCYEELCDLLVCSVIVFLSVFSDLKDNIREGFLKSSAFKDTCSIYEYKPVWL